MVVFCCCCQKNNEWQVLLRSFVCEMTDPDMGLAIEDICQESLLQKRTYFGQYAQILSAIESPWQAFSCFICLFLAYLFISCNLSAYWIAVRSPRCCIPSLVWTEPRLEAAINWSCNRRIPIFQFLFLTSWVVGAHYWNNYYIYSRVCPFYLKKKF
jgi:hypothetical protein